MNFAVFLMGENFPINGEASLQGFFVTKRIEASSEEIASAQAIAAVKADPRLSNAFSVATGAVPEITVRVVHQLPDFIKMGDTEYQFFPMEEP